MIEVMPIGYVDYAYEHLAQTCKLWYFEMQSEVPEGEFQAVINFAHVS